MTAASARPARWWHPVPPAPDHPAEASGGGAVACDLCPHRCRIGPGGRGRCRYRENQAGHLVSTNYGRISASGYDPIEKKPLYHFLPGSYILSLGTVGCNLRCGFCQNWRISQAPAPTTYLSPAAAAAMAGGPPGGEPSAGIAYTYSEPLVWWEYVHDTAQLVRQRGLANVLVTNGFIETEPLAELLPWIDAMNVDVKAFADDFYRDTCGGSLGPVRRTVEMAHRQGVHVEVTTLLVPGMNDHPGQLRELARWLGGLGRHIPLHFSRYFPNYRMSQPGPTPARTLEQARDLAGEYLDYVYVGNAFEVESADTRCPRCGSLVIARRGYQVSREGLAGAGCARCGHPVLAAARRRDRM